MRVEEKLELIRNFIGQDPIQFIRKHYRSEYADIMQGKMTEKTAEILETCKHNADKRSPLAYAQELILAWVVEDYIFDILMQNKYICTYKIGVDNKRELVKNSKITSNADLVIEIAESENNVERFYIEVVSDFHNYWNKHEVGHLRDNKLINLVKKSEEENIFLLAVDIQNKKIGFIEVKENMDMQYIEHHFAFGGKSAYQIDMYKSKFFNIEDIEIEIDNLLIA